LSQLIFKNYGGSYQLRIQDAQDLEKIKFLEEPHWAVTSIPVNSLSCDKQFSSYVDTDQNGRIRTDELKAALDWLFRCHTNRKCLSERTDILRLNDIDTSHPEGKKLHSVSKLILTNLKSPNMLEISLSQVRDEQNIMASAANNGDGIISPDAIPDSDLSKLITSVMDTVGSVLDASGKPGISQEQLNSFFHESESYLAWRAEGEIPKGKDTTEIMPWGNETSEAYECMTKYEDKIDQYFTQCSMVRFDEKTGAHMQLQPKDLEEIDFTDRSIMEVRLKNAPLTLPSAEGILNFESMINPFYVEFLIDLNERVLKRALGKATKQITQKQWDRVKNIFTAHRKWIKNKQGTKVEKLGAEIVRSYIKGSLKERLSDLISQDMAVADELNQIDNLEKLILYQRWLMELVNNFVNLSNLYNPERRALFEMGTLVIDGKEVTFTMRVQNREAHKKIAERSYIYLLYVEVTGRQDKDIKFEIAAAVTSGTAKGYHIGKRGIFFTIDGKEWEAEIVDILDNPISIWESVISPFQQFTAFIRKQIDKFKKSSQSKINENLAAPSASGITRDLLLGGGVAIAALGSSFAYVTKALSQVKSVHILVALVGLLSIVLLPGMIIGLMKIRKRNMGLLLEALGWAVNVNMRLNNSLGRLFTHTPRLPEDARKEREDVVAQFVKKFRYNPQRSGKLATVVLVLLLILLVLILVLNSHPDNF